jgi:hypothetical protein
MTLGRKIAVHALLAAPPVPDLYAHHRHRHRPDGPLPLVHQDLSEDPETFHFDFTLPDHSLLIQAYPDIGDRKN